MNERAARLQDVLARLGSACERVGRPAESVRLVAVSKTFGPDAVREVAEGGQVVFGENRVQEARQKIPSCPGNLEWHLVGHLQRNKAALAASLFHMVHGVDSVRLLEALNEACGALGKVLPVLVQVNVSGEASKFGIEPEALGQLLDAATRCLSLDVMGLMTIPPFAPDAEAARPYFARLRELRDRCRADSGFELPELSMGMSHDFEIAIAEGATWVRVGTDIFGKRERT